MSDSNYYNRYLLLDCEGSDDGTTLSDLSFRGHAITLNGGAKTKTAQYKFGTSSVLLASAGDYISLSSETLGSVAFTVEAFVRFTALPVSDGDTECLFSFADTNGWGLYVVLTRISGVTRFQLGVSSTGSSWYPVNPLSYVGAKTTWSIDTWYHVAVEFTDKVTYPTPCYHVYIDGVADISAPGPNAPIGQTRWRIGYHTVSNPHQLTGYIDSVRVTKGMRKYGAAFTPPSEEFSAFGPSPIYTTVSAQFRSDVSPFRLGV